MSALSLLSSNCRLFSFTSGPWCDTQVGECVNVLLMQLDAVHTGTARLVQYTELQSWYINSTAQRSQLVDERVSGWMSHWSRWSSDHPGWFVR